MPNDPLYVIQAMPMMPGVVKYFNIYEETFTFVDKPNATRFMSKVLANGWLAKVKLLYRSYKLSVVKL